MDKHLQTYARKRREDAGQPELHPAARRVLQSEVAKLRQPAGTQGGSFWELLSLRWPRLAFTAAIFVAFAVGIWSLLPEQNRASRPALMSRHFEMPLDATAPFEMKAPGQKEKAAADGFFPMADKKMTTESAMDSEQRQNKTPAIRGLAESATRNATDPLSLEGSKSDFDSDGVEAPTIRARRAGSPRSTPATDARVNTPTFTTAIVAEPSAVTFNDSVTYSETPAAGQQKLYVATGNRGAVTDGTTRFFFSANNPTNTRSEGLAWRSDAFRGDPPNGANPGNGLLADSASATQISNGILRGALNTNAGFESAARTQAPVGAAAKARSGAMGDLALNSPQSVLPPAPSAKATEERARLETESTQAQSVLAARPERFFRETKPASLESEREFLLTEVAPPSPLGEVAIAPSVSPGPVTPFTQPAPARSMNRAATTGQQPATAPLFRGGGNAVAAPTKGESNAALGYRFARPKVADESMTASKNSLTSTAPSVLERFDFEQDAAGVRLIDSDGSIYAGRLITETAMAGESLAAIRDQGQIPALAKDSLKPTDAGKVLEQSGGQFAWAERAATNTTFRVSGTNRTSGLLVTFTGSLVSGTAAAEGQRKLAVTRDQAQRFRGVRAPDMDAGASPRLLGRLRIGTTNETDFFATPTAR